MFNPISASESIKNEFISYITTSFHIADKDYANQFQKALNNTDIVVKGPYLDISDSFETGATITDLINKKEVSPLFRELEPDVSESEKEIKLERKLYRHQESSIRKINEEHNLVITTGTGSGKTECFMIPIINHLLREKEAGTLSDGVRAIIIYPMNALANDQMKRLRAILCNYPDITFGVYNSSTEEETDAGIAEYGNIFKDEDGRPLKPLKNEAISRKWMRSKPPHILITNYAMLEYMMLRPNDDLVFADSRLKFLVLDEAHIYRGATGIETSLLLRRLKARISNAGSVRHILTSATLGGEEANKDIAIFAKTLCDADFREDDIIRSNPQVPEFPSELKEYPMGLFAELADPKESLDTILDRYQVDFDKNASDSEIIYDLCLGSQFYKELRKKARHPMTVREITAAINKSMAVSEDDVVNLICVASRGEKNKTPLIKARFHMFVRALEGAYITLGSHKNLFLNRTNTANDGETRAFEAAICNECGRVGIAGKIDHDIFVPVNNRWDDDIEMYLLQDQNEKWDDLEADDEEEEENSSEIAKEDFVICSKCGRMIGESIKGEISCEHGQNHLVRLRRAKKTESGDHRCPCCNSGRMKTFYLGYDAATAVLGTELYEQLPETETVLKRKSSEGATGGMFSFAPTEEKAEVIKRQRQFLSFSDSRGEAAYFAVYMSSYYQEFLRRRGLWHIITQNRDNINANPWSISRLIDELTSYFDTNRSFAKPGESENENLTAVSRKQAWIAVLNEMVNGRRSTSLVSLGVLDFYYKGNLPQMMKGFAGDKYDVKDVTGLFDLLSMDIVYNGAIGDKEANLSDDERQYIYYSIARRRFIKKKSENEKGKNYISGWLPSRQKNNRILRVMKVLGVSEEDAVKILEAYWDEILGKGEYSLEADGSYFFMPIDRFCVKAGNEELPVYVCTKCGRTTMKNAKNQCISIRCGGTLRRIPHDDLIKDNHFARLYSSDQMKPFHIKEHTAQLGREESQEYQQMFVKKDLNALSCSTTFEMGVDVGDLETVYLRNIPPTPANYVQRAGRAGRSVHAAAYALTYAKLSSHDFTYYKDPTRMISGKIGVPYFSIANRKVAMRHIYAVALSEFFSLHEDVYNNNDANVFLNEDGYETLCEYLNSKPDDLKTILRKSIPESLHDEMGIPDYSWKDTLIGEDGVLKTAVEDFRNTVSWYEAEIKRLHRAKDPSAETRYLFQLMDYRRNPEDRKKRRNRHNELIEFLVRNNVLPKYGFPVDTAELSQGLNQTQKKQLQMSRDLQIAIAEYAPDAQVVADGKLYTSRYIRKSPQGTGKDWEESFIAQCKNETCQSWNFLRKEPSKDGEKCVSCKQLIPHVKWKRAIEPRKGFIADFNPPDVPLRKPDRAFKSEDYYIGDTQRHNVEKRTYLAGGEHKFRMETSTNDSLMVVCKDDFFVCERCGYAVSSRTASSKEKNSTFVSKIKRKHTAPWDKPCEGMLNKRSLCHTFKTDVVQIVFGSPRAKNKSTMLSVMYALLEAISDYLDIERNDIKGCLHKVKYERSLVYSVILYDAVGGGAGHVRRIVSEDAGVFQQIIGKALEITKGCSCDTSCYNCLRNYQNQAYHDSLDRKAAYEFMQAFAGAVTNISDEEFEKDHEMKEPVKTTAEKLKIIDSYPCGYTTWNEFKVLLPETVLPAIEDFDHFGIPMPTDSYCRCKFTGIEGDTEILLRWEDAKIMVFENEHEKFDLPGWKSLYVSEIRANKFMELF